VKKNPLDWPASGVFVYFFERFSMSLIAISIVFILFALFVGFLAMAVFDGGKESGFILLVFCVSLAWTSGIVFCVHICEKEAVSVGVAEYYLDKNNNRKWRWIAPQQKEEKEETKGE
jgi:hypothetical protein